MYVLLSHVSKRYSKSCTFFTQSFYPVHLQISKQRCNTIDSFDDKLLIFFEINHHSDICVVTAHSRKIFIFRNNYYTVEMSEDGQELDFDNPARHQVDHILLFQMTQITTVGLTMFVLETAITVQGCIPVLVCWVVMARE
jgi:hypothetical protein